MTPAERKARLVRRLDRASARITEARVLLKAFGFGEAVEIAIVSAMSELGDAESLNNQGVEYHESS